MNKKKNIILMIVLNIFNILFWNLCVFLSVLLWGVDIWLFFLLFFDIDELIIFFCFGGFLIINDSKDVIKIILIGCVIIIFWKNEIIIDVSYLLDVFVFYIKL